MVNKKKIKPLMPALRERKRYLAFEVISETPITNYKAVENAIHNKSLDFLGELGCAEAGIILLKEKYNQPKQRGVIRVNNKSLNKLRATLALIEQIEDTNVIVQSLGTSGVLNKVDKQFIAG